MADDKKSKRRQRSDSKEAAVDGLARAKNLIEPPDYVHLEQEALPFWYAIIKTRANWTDADLVQAAELARVQHEIEYYRKLAGKQLRLMKDAEGELKISPLNKIVNELVALQMSLSRQLQVHARATQGEARDQIKRNQVYHEAQDKVQAHGQDIGGFIKYPEKRLN